ncbi:MAG TPA: hypothetical protein VJW94_07800 [Candidatus Acidoferrum sp.]|nr:hypothetical protein [Candidatus Acidoferrum sp.]
MAEQDQSWGEVKHREEVLGLPFLSDEYATKVLQPDGLVTCGAPGFVRSSNRFRIADHPGVGRFGQR